LASARKKLLLSILLVIGLFAVPSVSAEPSSCVFEGFLNETSSPTVDYCGTSNDATWFGDPQSITGISKAEGDWGGPTDALDFDGQDDFLNISESSEVNFDAADSFSVSAWVKTSSSGDYAVVSDLAETSSGLEGWELFLNPSNEAYINLQFFDDGTKASFDTAGRGLSPIADNEWHHIVAIYGGCGDETCINLYLDNQSVGAIDVSGSLSEIQNNQNILIGARPRLPQGSVQRFTDGGIDEVKLYNKQINSSEVSNLYQYDTISYSVSDISFSSYSPSENEVVPSGDVNLSVSTSISGDKELENITVYTNETGTWSSRDSQTLLGTTSETGFVRSLDESSIKYGFQVYDNESNRTCITRLQTMAMM